MDSANPDSLDPRPQPSGPRSSRKHTPKVNKGLYQRAIKDAFVKLNPRQMLKNRDLFFGLVDHHGAADD